MTKFTPPTDFPHECQSISGNKVTLLAVDTNGIYACFWHSQVGTTVAVMQRPEDLRDLPVVTSTWQKVYPSSHSATFNDRQSADTVAGPHRIAVLRRDTVDGVTTWTLEGV